MAAAKSVRDYRALVPREPPEGLREWVLETCRDELDCHGLLYEAEYVEDWGLDFLVDPQAKPRKTKVVRVTCSSCGKSLLLNWARDEPRGYGFVLPDDEEGDWAHTITAAGDEVVCPICGKRALVNKRAAVRGWYVAAGCQVMSAAVLETKELVLTGWIVQRRIYKAGCESLELLPAEAYVFSAADCVQLMGWMNGYSGTGGYFIQYTSRWRMPRPWRERWGQTEDIYGLTPELIDGCCLPHCKLDVYMRARPGGSHYPVAYLRLYQAHPNVEAVLVHGLPRVLDGLIASRTGAADWVEKNDRGRLELPELDWTQTRPAQMLHLTREELRMARGQDWEKLFWELFVGAKAAGELLSAEDMENAFRLGDENLTMLIPRGQVGKSVRYLLSQCEAMAAEVDGAGADPIPDAVLLRDYWDVSERLDRDLTDPSVKYPTDLIAAHDRAAELMRQKAADALAALFRIRRRALKKYVYAAHGLLIRPAASQRELTAEGDALHHCVGTYGKKHAEGSTAIFFIRRVDRPKESFYTLELDEKELRVRQNRGIRNCARTPEIETFEAEWLAWIRAGAPRGRNGRPVTVEKTGRRGRAA